MALEQFDPCFPFLTIDTGSRDINLFSTGKRIAYIPEFPGTFKNKFPEEFQKLSSFQPFMCQQHCDEKEKGFLGLDKVIQVFLIFFLN